MLSFNYYSFFFFNMWLFCERQSARSSANMQKTLSQFADVTGSWHTDLSSSNGILAPGNLGLKRSHETQRGT